MSSQITIKVRKDCKILTDFDGFSGSSCYMEAEKLNALLARLGIKPSRNDIEDKSSVEVTDVEKETVTN